MIGRRLGFHTLLNQAPNGLCAGRDVRLLPTPIVKATKPFFGRAHLKNLICHSCHEGLVYQVLTGSNLAGNYLVQPNGMYQHPARPNQEHGDTDAQG